MVTCAATSTRRQGVQRDRLLARRPACEYHGDQPPLRAVCHVCHSAPSVPATRAPGAPRRRHATAGDPTPARLPGVPHDLTGTSPQSRLPAACAIGFRRCRPKTTPSIGAGRKPMGDQLKLHLPDGKHHAATSRPVTVGGCLPHLVPLQCSVVAHGEQLQTSVRVGSKRRRVLRTRP